MKNKSKNLLFLSAVLFPGSSHFYLGYRIRGLIYFLTSPLIISTIISLFDLNNIYDKHQGDSIKDRAPDSLMIGACYLFSLILLTIIIFKISLVQSANYSGRWGALSSEKMDFIFNNPIGYLTATIFLTAFVFSVINLFSIQSNKSFFAPIIGLCCAILFLGVLNTFLGIETTYSSIALADPATKQMLMARGIYLSISSIIVCSIFISPILMILAYFEMLKTLLFKD